MRRLLLLAFGWNWQLFVLVWLRLVLIWCEYNPRRLIVLCLALTLGCLVWWFRLVSMLIGIVSLRRVLLLCYRLMALRRFLRVRPVSAVGIRLLRRVDTLMFGSLMLSCLLGHVVLRHS